MVRYFWATLGHRERHVIISRNNAYHGATVCGASVGGMACMFRVACRWLIIALKTYWSEIQRNWNKYGILLICDEVICGLGRWRLGRRA
ncbi:MAG: hypothetical protein B7X35_00720 [Halothiobacillus sp. 14-56-357]|jgi:adenosylmethionine-8-amino-7-oxononanoate aminotransferase|uniref:hypothetical protein n=1 Tax=Halothiobacillus sp. 15-55-196 TaxID=1970382 RepID=UPI000BCEBB49|nr:hypothetical protein [Halothiobacillus sp. 15-55-196]OZB36209.1 MAG: hypothetical protein B7X44_06985 [Halothiobacillus sp. 15-55-196]OZB57592.1 MAG: hypothetical protein B7X35_00720 [Halothiobacillus sp. 14-56-357]OZB79164.1 MAG: hypothetical protein B7X29_01985 [Halothiobacillus sp. 13-55-115]